MNKKEKTILNKNNKREELINEENDKVLTDMICYLRVSVISKYNQELVRADLIEMILDAQERGENIQQVMGKDYKQICDNIIAEFPQETKAKKAIEYIRIALICVVIFVTILVILILFMACSYLFNSTILIMPLYVAVISVVILFIIERVLNKIV